MKHRATIALAAYFAIVVPALVIFCACTAPSPGHDTKAAIVDQLCVLRPNPDFIEQASRQLEEYGFQVDVFSAGNITIDLYRTLPDYGYQLIIFRAHSGLLGIDPRVLNKTWLYTNEPYSKTSYIIEQMDDRITYARTTDEGPWCFAVSAEFFNKSTDIPFNNTVIIMMGCDALHFNDMAQAFIGKGASTYIAWDASVILSYVDRATPVLLEQLCSKRLTVKDAISSTMVNMGRDPKYKSVLGCYPRESAGKTLAQLIK